jgi:hypothetical protein
MLTTEITPAKERVGGHYEVTETPWATDYAWVPGEEEFERRLLEEVLRPWHAAYAEWAKVEWAHPEEQQLVELEAL